MVGNGKLTGIVLKETIAVSGTICVNSTLHTSEFLVDSHLMTRTCVAQAQVWCAQCAFHIISCVIIMRSCCVFNSPRLIPFPLLAVCLLSSLVVLFFFLAISLFFHDVVDKFPVHSRKWGPWHPCRVRPSHRLWAQRLSHLGNHWTVHPGIHRRKRVPELAWPRVRWLHHRHGALFTTVHPGATRCGEP